MPQIIYLDSSDFSDLSADETTISNDNRAILAALRSSALDGSAQYLLSGIQLSEAVHATDDPLHKQSAVRRASLMQELCARNFLRLPHEVMRLELEKAIRGATDARLSREELFSGKSEWFGLPLTADLGSKRQKATDEFEKHISHLPRSERRKLKSDWKLSKASGRVRWRTLLSGKSQTTLREFPFNLLNEQFVLDWIVGDRSDDEFQERLLEIINDPKGLIKSVLDLTDERSTIYGLLRTQGAEIFSRIENSLSPVIEPASTLIDMGHSAELSKTLRHAIKKSDFRRTIVAGFAGSSVEHLDDSALERIVAACPSVSVVLNMYTAYALSLLDANLQRWRHGNRSIVTRKSSDFGDMMHATYAPYCDIFRCDAFFASLLKQDANIRCRVVTRDQLRYLSGHVAA